METRTKARTETADPLFRVDWEIDLGVANRSPKTIQLYGNTLGQFEAFLRDMGMPLAPANICREHVAYYLESLQKAGKAEATVAARYRALRRYFHWLEDIGERKDSPMAKMQEPKISEHMAPCLSEDELRLLVKACSGSLWTDKRDRALIRLAVDSGLRRSELADLQVEDVDLAAGIVRVRRGKGGRERLSAFGRKTASDLAAYLRARRGLRDADLPWFWLGGRGGRLTSSGVGQVVVNRAKRAGVKAHVHTLRHTFAHMSKAAGASDEDVMSLGGWRDHDMMRRYGASQAAARAKEAHRSFSPGDKF